MNNIVIRIDDESKMIVDIYPVSDWDGFEKLAKYIENEFTAEIETKFDGPGSRLWRFRKDSYVFELIFDDGYGNYLREFSEGSSSLLKKISADLDSRFS